MAELPDELVQEREQLVAVIYEAFAGVTRNGGVSWSETEVIDLHGTPEERATARAQDKDTSWEELVEQGEWEIFDGAGAMSFLDAVGFRYYMPAAMLQAIQREYGEEVAFALTLKVDDLREHRLSKWVLLSEAQRQCIARFLRYMMAVTEFQRDTTWHKTWKEALESYWQESP